MSAVVYPTSSIKNIARTYAHNKSCTKTTSQPNICRYGLKIGAASLLVPDGNFSYDKGGETEQICGVAFCVICFEGWSKRNPSEDCRTRCGNNHLPNESWVDNADDSVGQKMNWYSTQNSSMSLILTDRALRHCSPPLSSDRCAVARLRQYTHP
eukprot:scaffold56885_cov31-Attheya_sp.AAC.2